MGRNMIIVGGGGLAREVAMLVGAINRQKPTWDLMGFVGGAGEEAGQRLGSGHVLGDDAWLLSSEVEADLVIAIGLPAVKARVAERYLAHEGRFGFPNLVHPSATVDAVAFGRGNVVAAGAVMTCDISVGDFNLFNYNCTVGHDVVVGSFNVVNPGANIAGGACIADRVLIGTGCQVLENTKVGSDATLGAGGVVRSEVLDGQTVVGVPARPVRRG